MMSKQNFYDTVQKQLGAQTSVSADQATRAVFQVLHERIEPGQAGHIETHLPQDLKPDWQISSGGMLGRGSGNVQRRDREEFLEAVQQRANLRRQEEATEVTKAVFGTLKQILPQKDIEDTADELPPDLRQLWLEARTSGTRA